MGVHVDIDAPKGQDLAKIMEEMRENYERIALKNQQELKAWHDSQVGLKVGPSLLQRASSHLQLCDFSLVVVPFSPVDRGSVPGNREHDRPEGSNRDFV